MKINKNRQQSGITLIALVITIIVMLILVAVTISMAINGGLFDYAGKAVRDTQNAINAEQELANLESGLTVDELIDKYTNGTTGGTGGSGNTLPTYAEAEFDETTGMLAENATYASGYTNTDGTTETDDYYDMMLSVQENKGFYIGRFEAGTEEARYYEVDNGTDTLVVKRDVYPYNNVAWGKSMSDYESTVKLIWDDDEEDDIFSEEGYDYGHGAVYLSKHLLDGQDTGATSTLCYGIQWDAMLSFIEDKDHDIDDSTDWGNYYNKDWTIDRTSAKYSADYGKTWKEVPTDGLDKDDETVILLTTGASDEFAAKNIYDVAGNEYEWTMEARSTIRRVTRGRLLPQQRRRRSCFCPQQRQLSVLLPQSHFFQVRTLYNKRIVCYITVGLCANSNSLPNPC